MLCTFIYHKCPITPHRVNARHFLHLSHLNSHRISWCTLIIKHIPLHIITMSALGMTVFGLSTESPITSGGRATDDDGFIALSGSTRDTLVPTYSNEVLLSTTNPPPLIHLTTFDLLRSSITYARQLIFALHAPHGTFGNVQHRVTLMGDARSFDYTLAHYMSVSYTHLTLPTKRIV